VCFLVSYEYFFLFAYIIYYIINIFLTYIHTYIYTHTHIHTSYLFGLTFEPSPSPNKLAAAAAAAAAADDAPAAIGAEEDTALRCSFSPAAGTARDIATAAARLALDTLPGFRISGVGFSFRV
jgi:hypothetical protein